MRKPLLNKILEYLPYFLVVLIIVLPWLYQSGYLFFTDFVSGPILSIHWFASSVISDLFLKFFSLLLPTDLSQKLFITAILLFFILAGKRLASIFLPKKPVLIFLVSLFFLFNPFVYDRIGYGQFGVVLSLGCMMFSASYLLEYLERKQIKQILFAGIFSGLSILFVVHFVFFNLVFYFLFFIILLINRRNYRLRNIVFCIPLVLLIVLILNSGWIIGLFFNNLGGRDFLSSGITKQDFFAFQTAGHNVWQALTNVILMGGFWGKDQNRYIDLMLLAGNWGRSFIILLPIMIWGAISAFQDKKRRALVIGLIIIIIISIFLALGIRTGMGERVTFFLFDHLPFYKGMRETQKWISIVVICYGIFLAWGLNVFFSTKIIKKHNILFEIILVAIIVMQTPLMVWGMRGQFQPTNYPADWQEINEFIIRNPNNLNIPKNPNNPKNCDSNILFLPWHAYMSFDFTQRIVANPTSNFFQCPVVSGTNMEWGGIYDNSGNKEGTLVDKWVGSQGNSDFLDKNELNIGYVILAKEIDWDSYSWLDSNKGLKLVKENKYLRLYKISNE